MIDFIFPGKRSYTALGRNCFDTVGICMKQNLTMQDCSLHSK